MDSSIHRTLGRGRGDMEADPVVAALDALEEASSPLLKKEVLAAG